MTYYKTVFHYQIAIHVTPDSEAGASGQVAINIGADQGLQKDTNLTFIRTMSSITPGRVQTLLLTFSEPITSIKSGFFSWYRFPGLQFSKDRDKGTKIGINFIEINYLSHSYQL